MTPHNEDAPDVQVEGAETHREGTPVLATHSTPPARPEADALRQLADLLDEHRDLRAPEHIGCVQVAADERAADELRARLGGVWSVEQIGEISYVRQIGPVQIRILTGRRALRLVA